MNLNSIRMLPSAIFAFFLLLATGAHASAPLSLSLWAPKMQWPKDGDVSGLRLAVYGSSQNITGADISLLGKTEGGLSGVAFGLVSFVGKEARGLVSCFYSETQSMTGLQIGFVNKTEELNGLQFGFVNFAAGGKGVQIGLVNFFGGAKYPVLPIVNAKF